MGSLLQNKNRIRQREWWWPIFIYLFDVSIVNAWVLWRKIKNKNQQLLEFRRNLAITVLKAHGTPANQGKRPAPVFSGFGYGGMNHWLESSNRRRCAYCGGSASFQCSKCNVGMHPKCQKLYHTKE